MSDDFSPSPFFAGAKHGYVYSTRKGKTGYYRDASSLSSNGDEPASKKQRTTTTTTTMSSNGGGGDILASHEAAAAGRTILTLTLSGIKQTTLALEKAITENSSKRSHHSNSPADYLDSEMALYDLIVAIKDTWPALDSNLHQVLVDLSVWSSIIGLTTHENADIANAAVTTLAEMVDADDAASQDSCVLGDNILENAALPILALNLFRLKNGDLEDEKGIASTLQLVESLLEIESAGVLTSVQSVLLDTAFMGWCTARIATPPEEGFPPLYSANRLLACELMATIASSLLSSSAITGANVTFLLDKVPAHESLAGNEFYTKSSNSINAVEAILVSLAPYRNADPETIEEVEFLENMFDILSAMLLLRQDSVAEAFRESQGMALLLLMVKSGLHVAGAALKILAAIVDNKARAEMVIDGGGLKVLFGIFMQQKGKVPKAAACTTAGRELPKDKASKAYKKAAGERREWARGVESNVINLLYALSRFLDASSPQDAQARLVAKFAESEAVKCDRLVELCLKYDERARNAEMKFLTSEEAEEAEEEDGGDIAMLGLNAKLEGGGDLYHRLGSIMAFVAAESKGCYGRMLEQLKMQQSGITLVKDAVTEFGNLLGSGDEKERLEQLLASI
jgi:beta-catenin-like protein 1